MGDNKEEFIFINWLRCFALGLIVYDHLGAFRNQDWIINVILSKIFFTPLNIIQWGGALGVSIFFMISGFLLAHGVDKKGYTVKSLHKKLMRLYLPTLLACFTFFLFQLIVAKVTQRGYWQQFSIQQWLTGGSLVGYLTGSGDLINGTTWYLVPTFYAYILVSLFAAIVKKRAFIGIISMQICVALCMFMKYVFVSSDSLIPILSWCWYLYILFYGIILYYIWNKRLTLKEIISVLIINYGLLIAGIYMYNPMYAESQSYVISVVYAFLVMVVGIYLNSHYNLKNSTLVKKISNLSFDIYLVHMTYGSFISTILSQYVGYTISFLVSVILVLFIAILHQKVWKKFCFLNRRSKMSI